MSIPGSGAGGNFLEQLLGDLLKMMGTGTSSNSRIELARTLAHGVATGGEPEANVEPVERMRYEELVRIAELHVSEITGLQTSPSGTPLEVLAVGPGSWAWHTVDDWRFLLDAMSESGGSTGSESTPGARPDAGDGDARRPRGIESGPAGSSGSGRAGSSGSGPEGPFGSGPEGSSGSGPVGPLPADPFPSDPSSFDPSSFDPSALDPSSFDPSALDRLVGGGGLGDPSELLARWITTMTPMLAAMQLGSAVGHLARTTLGQYELPIPRLSSTRLLVVPSTIVRFSEDWSLPEEEVRLWVCLREVTSHAVLTRPHVAERLRELFVSVVQGISEDTSGILDRLGGLDPSDPESFQALMGDPEALLAQEPSPQRKWAGEELMAITAALAGYIEHVLDEAAARLLGGRGALTEAWRRRLVDREMSERAAEVMVGLDIGPASVDNGVAFVQGILERAGEDGLARLWEQSSTLPTPAEIEAPGLWLERISFKD
ncbi:MAG TPA: zinc-dependent metalloprotease, partial [Acidimicrobiales bacterium]|nr:zinc-dependent metalloprotease [Acidimicrobiales bacterium]